MISRLISFVISFCIWTMLSWPPDLQHSIIGIIVAVFIAFITGDLFTYRPTHFTHITRYLWFVYYVFVFLWECFKANIDVALRVLNPRMPIKPGIVKIKTGLKSDIALTFLANSITLTPGTFCIDVNQKKGILYIHWINVGSTDTDQATKLIAGKFEKILKRIFE